MKFKKSFTQQEPISKTAIERAVEVMESGRLHRYNTEPGEFSEVDLLEKEFAAYMGTPYCLACSSGGYALSIALRSTGVKPGDKVLCNSYTLAPVPGSIVGSGATVVLVETADDYTIDLDDLREKAISSGAKFFVLSLMRGHIPDMDLVVALCDEYGIVLIEDCAHTMGATWKGRKSGSFGIVSCFSTQTYKHLNSGEGGLFCTSDEEVMARAVIHSGSYMMYGNHAAVPDESVFEKVKYDTPNLSGRMDNLRASILRSQLLELDEKCVRRNKLYAVLDKGLREIEGIWLPERAEAERFVGSSIQFSLPEFNEEQVREFLKDCKADGVVLSWFGDSKPKQFTSRYDSWHYIESMEDLSKTKKVLSVMCDMRIPLTFDEADCQVICKIISSLVSGE